MEEFRRFEHAGWERVAHRYESAWAPLTTQFIGPLLDAAGAAPRRVLDVACGPGHVAREAARSGARCVGIDFSRRMVLRARTAHPGIEYLEGEAERLGFASGAFDAVVMNFGILHLADPDLALSEARRVLGPFGRYAFTVWARPEHNPGHRIVFDAVEAHADLSIRLPEGPPRLRFSDPDECRAAMGRAGFSPVSVRFDTVRRDWIVPTAGFLFEAERDAGVRTAGLLARQPIDRLERIRAAIEEGVRHHAVPGGFAIPMTAHVVSAAVP
jgi:SAM-dependent methyltransferase